MCGRVNHRTKCRLGRRFELHSNISERTLRTIPAAEIGRFRNASRRLVIDRNGIPLQRTKAGHLSRLLAPCCFWAPFSCLKDKKLNISEKN